MKLKLLFAMIFFSTSLLAQQQAVKLSDAKQTPETLLKQVQSGQVYLIDVRTPEEYKEGHLKYSKNIDYKAEGFGTKLNKLDKKKAVYVYCRSGNRSGKTLDSLKVLGFREFYNIGGFDSLKAEGLPAE